MNDKIHSSDPKDPSRQGNSADPFDVQDGRETYEDELADEFMKSVREDLGRQVEEEIEEEAAAEYDGQEQISLEETEGMGHKRKRRRKKYKALKIVCGVLGVLMLALIFLVGTPPGRRLLIRMAVTYIDSNIGREEVPVTDENGEAVTDADGNVIMEEERPNTHESPADARSEDYVTNIMLVGIESVLPGSRADTIMIASLDTREDKIKLTSILRDTYVNIPGYGMSKINAAYGRGGITSMYETIESNFKIRLDGYVMVNFEGLEAIVDALGGVSIELTAEEARYLNTTNYISNPEYRNVKEGVNLLNGNQVVGYCRVRKVATVGGANNDFGRTLRQRRVLTAIFEGYKSKGIGELLGLMNTLLPYVTTDLTAKQMENLLVDFIEEQITEIESLRIPAEGAYVGRTVEGAGSVLDPDLEANIQIMYEFIFGDESEEEETTAAE